MNTIKANIISRQRGLAAVEAVIVLPLLVFLALAIGEFGHALMLYTTLNKAQQDGARYLANEAINADTGNICLGPHVPVPLCAPDGSVVDGNVLATKNLIVFGNVGGGTSGDELLEGLTIGDVGVSEPAGLPGYVRVQVSYNFKPVFGDVLSTFGFGDGSFTLTFPLVSTVTMRAL